MATSIGISDAVDKLSKITGSLYHVLEEGIISILLPCEL